MQLNICSSTTRSGIFYFPNGSNAKALCWFNGWFCRIEKILIILSKQKINSYRFSNGISVALSSVPWCKKERQFNPVFDFASRDKSLMHLSLEPKIPNNVEPYGGWEAWRQDLIVRSTWITWAKVFNNITFNNTFKNIFIKATATYDAFHQCPGIGYPLLLWDTNSSASPPPQ